LGIFDSSTQSRTTLSGAYPVNVGTSSRTFALSNIVKVITGLPR
jgi:hypothetical protein